MQNMSHVCGADYFHAPVTFSVPLTPKIIYYTETRHSLNFFKMSEGKCFCPTRMTEC